MEHMNQVQCCIFSNNNINCDKQLICTVKSIKLCLTLLAGQLGGTGLPCYPPPTPHGKPPLLALKGLVGALKPNRFMGC